MFDTSGAKCSETDPELFFPEGFQTPYQIHSVLKICAACPIYLKCREYSLQYDLYGWWAGTTRAERREIQKQRGIKPIPLKFPSSIEDLDVITTDESRRAS